MPSDRWHIGAASVIGPAHVRLGLPNQDAFCVEPERATPSPIVIGAVADGHGAARHFRSDRGAQIAVKTTAESLGWAFDGSDEIDLPELGKNITEGWRKRVEEDIIRVPYDRPVDHPHIPYGATALGLAADDAQLCLVQIGDGDILLGFAEGRIVRPFPPDPTLTGEQTRSLCQPDAEQHLRRWLAHRDWDDPIPDFVLMATDGVSKSLVSDEAFTELGRRYRERCLSSPELFAETIEALPAWLTNLVAKGSGDDATMILAARMPYNGDM